MGMCQNCRDPKKEFKGKGKSNVSKVTSFIISSNNKKQRRILSCQYSIYIIQFICNLRCRSIAPHQLHGHHLHRFSHQWKLRYSYVLDHAHLRILYELTTIHPNGYEDALRPILHCRSLSFVQYKCHLVHYIADLKVRLEQ